MKLLPILACLAIADFASAAPEKIFNDKDLAGWKTEGGACWSAADGILKGESNEKKEGSVLWTEKSYKDFTVECEFRFKGDLDSGIFLRNANEQIQIGVSRSLKRDMTGSPYIGSKGSYPVEAKGVKELLKEGEWNHFKIVAKGDTYTVFLNGKQVLEYASETAKESGPIGLQVHPGVAMKVEFRDLTVDQGI